LIEIPNVFASGKTILADAGLNVKDSSGEELLASPTTPTPHPPLPNEPLRPTLPLEYKQITTKFSKIRPKQYVKLPSNIFCRV
jgi:hypothetical protein